MLDVDWFGWALFGLLATTGLTAVMIAAQLGGLSRLDLPLILGTVVRRDPDRARVAGFFIHLSPVRASPLATRRRSHCCTAPPGGSAGCSGRCTSPSP